MTERTNHAEDPADASAELLDTMNDQVVALDNLATQIEKLNELIEAGVDKLSKSSLLGTILRKVTGD